MYGFFWFLIFFGVGLWISIVREGWWCFLVFWVFGFFSLEIVFWLFFLIEIFGLVFWLWLLFLWLIGVCYFFILFLVDIIDRYDLDVVNGVWFFFNVRFVGECFIIMVIFVMGVNIVGIVGL